MKRVPLTTIITAAFLVAVLIIFMVTTEVRFSEQAVRVRFGKADPAIIKEPGLYFRLPLIDEIKRYDTRIRVLDTPETELKTQDGQNLIVGCYALWRIKDVMKFQETIRKGIFEAEEFIRNRVTEARATVIGRHSMSDLFGLDAATVETSREKINQEMRDAAAPGLLSNYGIELVSVGIRRNAVPEETTQSIQQAMSAERNALATRYQSEGKSAAETIKSQAEADRKRILAFADRRAQEIQSAGALSEARILKKIESQDEQLFMWLRYLDALEAALKQKSTIFLDSTNTLFKYFDSPLAPASAPTMGEIPGGPPGSDKLSGPSNPAAAGAPGNP